MKNLSQSIAFIFVTISASILGQDMELNLDYAMAEKLAALPIHCIEVEYPNKLNQVLTDSSFLDSPSELHPIFYGCFDWHSSVHGHWLLASVLNRFPDSELAKEITDVFDRQFTAEKVAAELAYFEPKLEKSFERTYGWAWILKLQAELKSCAVDEKHGWSKSLQPLIDYIVVAYSAFLPKLVYPIRVGEHTNTAFGLSLALDYARDVGDQKFEALIVLRSKDYFLSDAGCPLTWEPSGFDFISPCLQEAELMSKILGAEAFEKWTKAFRPELLHKYFYLEPGIVLDRTDGKLVHLDGLNFNRAWCLYTIADALPKNRDALTVIADLQLRTSMPYVVDSDYMGSHWLATFLLYALEARATILD